MTDLRLGPRNDEGSMGQLRDLLRPSGRQGCARDSFLLYRSDCAGTGARVPIDSTKAVYRAVQVWRSPQARSCLFIHFVRDSRAIYHSHRESEARYRSPETGQVVVRPGEVVPVPRASARWLRNNLPVGLLLGTYVPSNRRLRFRCEDPCSEPEATLARIASDARLDYASLQDGVEFGSSERHNLGGSASRFNAHSIEPDRGPWRAGCDGQLQSVTLAARTLNRWYGYR